MENLLLHFSTHVFESRSKFSNSGAVTGYACISGISTFFPLLNEIMRVPKTVAISDKPSQTHFRRVKNDTKTGWKFSISKVGVEN